MASSNVARHLVDRRCAEPIARTEPGQQRTAEHHRRKRVRTSVTHVHAERRATVPLNDTLQTSLNSFPGLCPGRDNVLAVAPNHRHPQAIRILVQLLQRRTLRADKPAREHVVHIAADALDFFAALAVRPERDL
jgi:hypothetical protein